MPHDVEILAILPGIRIQERLAQHILREHHYRGEWFHDHADIHTLIASGLPCFELSSANQVAQLPRRNRQAARRAEIERRLAVFFEDVLLFLLQHDISDESFGLMLGDEPFVWRLKHKHNYRLGTQNKVRNLMSAYASRMGQAA